MVTGYELEWYGTERC